jgi:hypothetical protein
MILGLAGSFGAGKGEKRTLGASQEVVDIFEQKISYNLNSVCNTPVPDLFNFSSYSFCI